MKLEYTNVENPRFTDDTGSAIDCLVTFTKLGPLPFTASANDVEEHGVEIYQRCLAGEFGPVAPFVAPETSP